VIDEELEFKIEQLDLMVKRWRRFFNLYRKISKPGEASPKEEHEPISPAPTPPWPRTSG